MREHYHYAWAIVAMGTTLRVTANFVSQAFAVILVLANVYVRLVLPNKIN